MPRSLSCTHMPLDEAIVKALRAWKAVKRVAPLKQALRPRIGIASLIYITL